MFSERNNQAFFRIESMHENQTITYNSLREHSEAWYAAAVCGKNILHKVLELLSIPNSMFWGASQLPTECGQRVTCSLHKTKFWGWYWGCLFPLPALLLSFLSLGFSLCITCRVWKSCPCVSLYFPRFLLGSYCMAQYSRRCRQPSLFQNMLLDGWPYT